MPDYYQLLKKANQNTNQLVNNESNVVSKGGSGVNYYSLLKTGKSSPSVQTTPLNQTETKTGNILDKAGNLIKSGFTAIGNYINEKKQGIQEDKQTVQEYQQEAGTKGIFQKIYESSVIPTLDRQKTAIENSGNLNDINQSNLNMINKFLNMTPDERWQNRRVIKFFTDSVKTERNLKSFYSGTIGTVNSLIDGSAWLAGKAKNIKVLNNVSGKLENVLNQGSDNLDAWQKLIQPEDQSFSEEIFSGAGSSLPFFAIGAGFGKATQLLSKVSPAVAAWFGGSAAGAVEAMSEAGSVYDQNLKDGKTKEEANRAANKTFGANIVLNIITDRFGVFSEDKLGLKKIILSTSGEGIQEATQQVISNVNTNRPYDEGVIESGVIGAIIGGGMGAVGTNFMSNSDVETKTTEEEKSTVQPLKLPDNIEPAVVEKIQQLNIEDVNNPLTDETKTRVYQAVAGNGQGGTTWAFSTPEALANYLNNGDPNAVLKYVDVSKTDLVAHPERGDGVYTIEPKRQTVTEKKQTDKTKEIKKQKTSEVKENSKSEVYHYTLPSNVESINKNGFTSKARDSIHATGIYEGNGSQYGNARYKIDIDGLNLYDVGSDLRNSKNNNDFKTARVLENAMYNGDFTKLPKGYDGFIKTDENGNIEEVSLPKKLANSRMSKNPEIKNKDGVWEKTKTSKKSEVKGKKKKVVRVSNEQVPVGEGKKKVSRLEARVKNALGKVDEDVKESLGLSTFNKMNENDQIEKAAKYVIDKPEEALKVIKGEVAPPKGLLRNSVFVAMYNNSIGDVDLATKLASLSATRYGQELDILKKLNADSPVKVMNDILTIRREDFKKKHKTTTIQKMTDKEVKNIKNKVQKPTKGDWQSFISEIQC